MRTCPSCGGVIGVDCFNPQECAEIAFAQQQQSYQDSQQAIRSIDPMVKAIQDLEARVLALEESVRKLQPAVQ